ncbi:MAG TPA: metal ABC transporter permease [Anaerolineaceae bacterium]|jgi:zinc transport system permease protein|nr:metal ABC transporter permease [Chloroflexota bacterium]HOF27742.1 metal ABC transporter permease [Anaerolineaceae bacterium]
MIEALQSLLAYDFMRNALYASLLVGIVCGLVGTLVVLNRIVFLGGGIAHAAYGGIGLAYYFGQDPLLGAILFSILSALGMGVVHLRTKTRSDTLIGVMWSIGMAVGIIFVSLTPGFKADLMSYLFGSLLAVSAGDLRVMALVALLVGAFVAIFFRSLQAISYDETFSTVRNVPVSALYLLMLVMIGLTVVAAMRVVGLIMVIAMLTIPPAVAGLFLKDMKGMMLLSIGLSWLFSALGLLVSFTLNLQAGSVIILVAALSYLAAAGIKKLTTRPMA